METCIVWWARRRMPIHPAQTQAHEYLNEDVFIEMGLGPPGQAGPDDADKLGRRYSLENDDTRGRILSHPVSVLVEKP